MNKNYKCIDWFKRPQEDELTSFGNTNGNHFEMNINENIPIISDNPEEGRLYDSIWDMYYDEFEDAETM